MKIIYYYMGTLEGMWQRNEKNLHPDMVGAGTRSEPGMDERGSVKELYQQTLEAYGHFVRLYARLAIEGRVSPDVGSLARVDEGIGRAYERALIEQKRRMDSRYIIPIKEFDEGKKDRFTFETLLYKDLPLPLPGPISHKYYPTKELEPWIIKQDPFRRETTGLEKNPFPETIWDSKARVNLPDDLSALTTSPSPKDPFPESPIPTFHFPRKTGSWAGIDYLEYLRRLQKKPFVDKFAPDSW
jgi:hypothetical protein